VDARGLGTYRPRPAKGRGDCRPVEGTTVTKDAKFTKPKKVVRSFATSSPKVTTSLQEEAFFVTFVIVVTFVSLCRRAVVPQNPKFIPSSIRRAGPADSGSPKFSLRRLPT